VHGQFSNGVNIIFMSRIGKKPISIPKGVSVELGSMNAENYTREIFINGPKGTVSVFIPSVIAVEVEGNVIKCSVVNNDSHVSDLWGLSRALLAGAVVGVTEGYSKKLEIEGIGYRANLEGNILVLSLGFSHPIKIEPKDGVSFAVEKNSIIVSGNNKQAVGQFAAQIRALKKPEPYKGKGIRYAGEVVRRKAGKKAAVATTK